MIFIIRNHFPNLPNPKKEQTNKFRRRILSETLLEPIAQKNPLFFTKFLQQFKAS